MQKERQRKTKNPCLNCRMNPTLCICDLIPSLDLRTRLCLVIHKRELERTTNTGTLALKALKNGEVRIRGEQTGVLDLSDLLTSNYRTLLFYPSDEATELTTEFIQADSRPVQLIVPDGNWRQASKVHYRHHELKDVTRVKISTPNPSKLHMRKETRPEGMATLQAIAYALGIIESVEVQDQLLALYNAKLERTMNARQSFV